MSFPGMPALDSPFGVNKNKRVTGDVDNRWPDCPNSYVAGVVCDAARRIPAPSTYPAETPRRSAAPRRQHNIAQSAGEWTLLGCAHRLTLPGDVAAGGPRIFVRFGTASALPGVQRRCLQLQLYRPGRPTQPRRPTHRPGSARQGSCRVGRSAHRKAATGNRAQPLVGIRQPKRRYLTAVEGGAGRPPPPTLHGC